MTDFTTTKASDWISDSWGYLYVEQFPEVVQIPWSENALLQLLSQFIIDERPADQLLEGLFHEWCVRGDRGEMEEFTICHSQLYERVMKLRTARMDEES